MHAKRLAGNTGKGDLQALGSLIYNPIYLPDGFPARLTAVEYPQQPGLIDVATKQHRHADLDRTDSTERL